MNNIPRFCDFGISATFDAVLRYLAIFFFCGITVFIDIFCGIAVFGTPQCPPLLQFMNFFGIFLFIPKSIILFFFFLFFVLVLYVCLFACFCFFFLKTRSISRLVLQVPPHYLAVTVNVDVCGSVTPTDFQFI